MNQKERMLAGLPYKSWLDGLSDERLALRKLTHHYNIFPPGDRPEMIRLLKQIIGKTGEDLMIEPPFRCDYGSNIEVGNNFYANFNCVMLDVGKITIGENVMFGPNVSLYTAGHPLHPTSRTSGYEYGIPITIGDSVWLGGSTVVNPGVTIGDNVVIGSGSVVTKDIPANSVAVGNPCKVIHTVTEADREFYYRDFKFDITDY